jgi:hypothetical protein
MWIKSGGLDRGSLLRMEVRAAPTPPFAMPKMSAMEVEVALIRRLGSHMKSKKTRRPNRLAPLSTSPSSSQPQTYI